MHLNDSLGHHLHYTAHHHEQACAIAAEGYARVNQTVAVVNVTTGPGGLNALTGVFGQWTDSAPVLYLSGQVKVATMMSTYPHLRVRQLGDQEVDICRIVAPLVKYVALVDKPTDIRYHLERAIDVATSGRFGPVWLDIPVDVQGAMVDPEQLVGYTRSQLSKPDTTKICQSISEKITAADRPLIVAGHGVRLSDQISHFHQLLQKWRIPVVTTFNGMDVIPDGHPQWVGRIGSIGQRAGNFVLQNADCVLFLGTRNNIRQCSYNSENYAKNAIKIAVDIDPDELKKPTVVPEFSHCIDLALLIPALLDHSSSMARPKWLKWAQDRKAAFCYDRTSEYHQPSESLLNPYYFTHILTQSISDDAIVVMANGSACVCTFQAGVVKSSQQRFILNSGNAAMGFELPAAIGAAVNSPHRPVICIAGDGSIMMNLQELQTISHYQLPIKIFILCNDGYVSIKNTQRQFFNGRLVGADPSSGVSFPDFKKLADAFGIPYFNLDAKNSHTIQKILDEKGPLICAVMIRPDYFFSPKLTARQLPDQTMVSPSLEDMAPFLDPTILASHQWPGDLMLSDDALDISE